MFPWYAVLVLGLVLMVSALVWVIGALMRVRRNEPALPDFKSMMGRGALAPMAMIAMAADFGQTSREWLLWTALVVGGWLFTLILVRGVLSAMNLDARGAEAAADRSAS